MPSCAQTAGSPTPLNSTMFHKSVAEEKDKNGKTVENGHTNVQTINSRGQLLVSRVVRCVEKKEKIKNDDNNDATRTRDR